VLTGTPVERPANWALVYAEIDAAIDAVPPTLRSHRVVNRFDYGPDLIFRGVRVWRDDRFELYGNEPMIVPTTWLDSAGIDWTFDSPNAGSNALDHDPKWVPLFRGNYVSVHARKSALEAIKGGGS
jgi:hypothetical protein